MAVHHALDDEGVLTVRLDDGGKNTLVPDTLEALTQVLDEGDDAAAILLTGREGIFTAGLDTRWMQASDADGIRLLVIALGRCLMRWWTEPRPTVLAAPGHAIAAGSMLAMACDHAVAAENGWWGLTETRLDLELPRFGIALAQANLRNDRIEDLLLPGERVDAATAVEVGFADELAPATEVLQRGRARALELTQLPARAYARTKARLRQATAEEILADLETDIAAVTQHL